MSVAIIQTKKPIPKATFSAMSAISTAPKRATPTDHAVATPLLRPLSRGVVGSMATNDARLAVVGLLSGIRGHSNGDGMSLIRLTRWGRHLAWA